MARPRGVEYMYMSFRRPKHTSVHHIVPRSRKGGTDDASNLVLWNDRFHEAWHFLFINMTNEEIHEFIDIISRPQTVWTADDIAKLRHRIMRRSP